MDIEPVLKMWVSWRANNEHKKLGFKRQAAGFYSHVATGDKLTDESAIAVENLMQKLKQCDEDEFDILVAYYSPIPKNAAAKHLGIKESTFRYKAAKATAFAAGLFAGSNLKVEVYR